MKKLAVIIFSVILCVLDAAAQVDSARMALLDARMEEYFALLEQEPVTVKIEECDVLIEASQDPAVRQAIALKDDHYRHSALMGDEAVAIHVTDTWFIPGKVAMGSDATYSRRGCSRISTACR